MSKIDFLHPASVLQSELVTDPTTKQVGRYYFFLDRMHGSIWPASAAEKHDFTLHFRQSGKRRMCAAGRAVLPVFRQKED